MERIIITEVDNTSNVEALSSYDVVYVPGFSTIERSKEYTNEGEASLYRNPTLVTSKYQFINLFGKDAPVFAVDQDYPVEGEAAAGFPTYAIPNYVATDLESDPIALYTFSGASAADALADLKALYKEVDTTVEGWQIEDVNYFTVTSATSSSTTTLTLNDYTTTPSEGQFVVESAIRPCNDNWFEKDGSNNPFRSLDTQIAKKSKNKQYFLAKSATPPMFNGGTDADPGYRIALYLLSLGVPVYFEQMNATADEITVAKMYEGLEARFARTEGDPGEAVDYSFDNIGDYSVKYITSGGYPTFEYSSGLAENMIRLAWDRGDAIALVDHTNNPDRSIRAEGGPDSHSVIDEVRTGDFAQLGPIVGSYGAMFTPWYECTNSAITGGTLAGYQAQMPGSVAFLSALAVQLRDYNPWLAVSGVTRGQVPYCARLHTNQPLTNNVADSYQALPDATGETTAISINPITYIRNYGYCIWGNRTLRNNSGGTRATSFLNIRDLTSDIKKTLYEASQRLLFEQNNDVLWINFKAQITPLLDTMVSNYILSDYKIVKYTRDPETGEPVPAYKVLAVIRIMPINSTEIFELSVHLENNELAVAE